MATPPRASAGPERQVPSSPVEFRALPNPLTGLFDCDEGSDEEDGKVAQKRSRLRPQQDSDDEMQDAEDESEGESSSESKKGGDKKSFGAHRRGGHQRVTRVCCPFFLITICL